MARHYQELPAKMDPASRAGSARRVREELQGMALDELRSASDSPRRTWLRCLTFRRVPSRASSSARTCTSALSGTRFMRSAASFRFKPFFPRAARWRSAASATTRTDPTSSGPRSRIMAHISYSLSPWTRDLRFPPRPSGLRRSRKP
jgi:hypothetical protein